jgi:hypothetical protein
MNRRSARISPSLVLAFLAVLLALGGTAIGFAVGRNSVRSKNIAPNQVRARDLARVEARTGKLTAIDPVAGDGLFTEVDGSARCHHGEQLVSGGVRFHGTPNLSAPLRAAVLDSGPRTNIRTWEVRIASDLGSKTRKRFTVFATCLVR